MYGSRPGSDNVDSLVVPSRDYYKYEELSDAKFEHSTQTHNNHVDSTIGAYKNKLGGRAQHNGQTSLVSDVMSVFSVPVPGPGSCFQCSTLTDNTGLCQDIGRYYQRRQLSNNSDLPQFETQCTHAEKYCQVRRVDYKVDNMSGYAQWSLERSCVRDCEPFCVSMGGRTKVTYCTSCCRWDGSKRDDQGRWVAGERQDLCNIDNSGVSYDSWLSMVTMVVNIISICSKQM